jgi:hypothetical protein
LEGPRLIILILSLQISAFKLDGLCFKKQKQKA